MNILIKNFQQQEKKKESKNQKTSVKLQHLKRNYSRRSRVRERQRERKNKNVQGVQEVSPLWSRAISFLDLENVPAEDVRVIPRNVAVNISVRSAIGYLSGGRGRPGRGRCRRRQRLLDREGFGFAARIRLVSALPAKKPVRNTLSAFSNSRLADWHARAKTSPGCLPRVSDGRIKNLREKTVRPSVCLLAVR